MKRLPMRRIVLELRVAGLPSVGLPATMRRLRLLIGTRPDRYDAVKGGCTSGVSGGRPTWLINAAKLPLLISDYRKLWTTVARGQK